MLTKFGRAVTLSRPSSAAATYDAATGISTPVTPLTYAGIGALFDYKRTDVNASLVEQGDQRLYLSALAPMVEPTNSDEVVVGSKTYGVRNVGKLAPDGTTVVLYDLQLRGV